MKRITFVLFVVVAAALSAGLVGASVASSTGSVDAQDEQGEDIPSDRAITVTGQGSADATPDRAIVTIAVVAEGDNPATVRDDLREGADALREALAAAGVDDDRIRTVDYRIHEQHFDHYEQQDHERPAYRGVHTFRVTIDDVDRAGNVTDAAADANANVQWVSFTLSDERRSELRDRALTDAMDDARHQADTLATAGDLMVTGVRSVDASDRQFAPVGFDRPVFEVADEGTTTLEPGDVTVTVRVQVTYDAAEG